MCFFRILWLVIVSVSIVITHETCAETTVAHEKATEKVSALPDTTSLTIALTSKNAKAQNSSRIPLFIARAPGLEEHNSHVKRMVARLKKYLESSKQFVVTERVQALPKAKQQISALFPRYTCAFFVEYKPETKSYQWRLYDTSQATLIKGKKYLSPAAPMAPEEWARVCAHDMWYELLHEVSPFMTRLCYIRKKYTNIRSPRIATQLCISDIDGAHERVMLSNSCINIAPYWSPYSDFIFYSEFTQTNVRLMALDMQGTRRVVLDLDGTIAGISSSPSGHQIVYGRSGGIWRYEYDPIKRAGQHTLVIKEKDACACPTLLANGDIIYCCQGKIKRYTKATGTRLIIIDDGYCVGPAYHENKGIIVFSQRIDGQMQLVLYSVATAQKEQLTFDQGDKIDPCWSPCGNFIAFCKEHKGKSRIYTIDIRNRSCQAITPEQDTCCYPSWSPVYKVKAS